MTTYILSLSFVTFVKFKRNVKEIHQWEFPKREMLKLVFFQRLPPLLPAEHMADLEQVVDGDEHSLISIDTIYTRNLQRATSTSL